MASSLIVHLSRGLFTFLRPQPEEIRRALPNAEALLPEPQKIFLEDDDATPVIGFPLLRTRGLAALEEALAQYLESEEAAQLAYQNRDTFDSRLFASRWERYKGLLTQAIENTVVSNYGHNYPGIFWLQHSLVVAQILREVPRNMVRRDLTVGREHGDRLKYRVFLKYIDRVVTLTYDIIGRLASELDDVEESLFPRILDLMRDNVLIFTESHISRDLSELGSYFNGHLGIEGREFRHRLEELAKWQDAQLTRDRMLRAAATELMGGNPDDARTLLNQTGWSTVLASHPSYPSDRAFSGDQIQVWESLLVKLKEYEILHALRKMIVPLEWENSELGGSDDGALISRDRSLNTTWVGGPQVLRVSSATRPIDFFAAWVVDPLVERFGLVYDITDFSATISMLGRSEAQALDQAFRMMFRFQRRVNKLAFANRLKMEKYLGDGAFYSSRHARSMLVVAVQLQRAYRKALEQGLPFDRGLRIAINLGQYRLLPLEAGNHQARYEFFGHGLVELSRLATGKATQEIDEFRTYLVGQGYPAQQVAEFFAPLLRRDTELANKAEESRDFYAYINANGNLINEGIAATEPFVHALGFFPEIHAGHGGGGRGYIVVEVDGDNGMSRVGIRRLGVATFKGLEAMPIYEIVDAGDWTLVTDPKVRLPAGSYKAMPAQKLNEALDWLWAQSLKKRLSQAPTS